jgi:hypothetical protein
LFVVFVASVLFWSEKKSKKHICVLFVFSSFVYFFFGLYISFVVCSSVFVGGCFSSDTYVFGVMVEAVVLAVSWGSGAWGRIRPTGYQCRLRDQCQLGNMCQLGD